MSLKKSPLATLDRPETSRAVWQQEEWPSVGNKIQPAQDEPFWVGVIPDEEFLKPHAWIGYSRCEWEALALELGFDLVFVPRAVLAYKPSSVDTQTWCSTVGWKPTEGDTFRHAEHEPVPELQHQALKPDSASRRASGARIIVPFSGLRQYRVSAGFPRIDPA